MLKFGRRRPIARCPRLSLKNYLLRAMPAPPASVDYSLNAVGFSDILGNDSIGDCTAAGAMHVEDIFRGNAGVMTPTTADQAIDFYSATTGYVRGDPSTDQGGDENIVLSYWRDKGLFSDGTGKIAGWVAVNGADQGEVQTALWLFENLYFGVELPDAWTNPLPSGPGFRWDIAGDANPNTGHAFVGAGYNDQSVYINSWGFLGTISYPAIAKYATTPLQGELYAVLSEDAIIKASGKAPNGFGFQQLQADLQALS